jgi:hypothetical protein
MKTSIRLAIVAIALLFDLSVATASNSGESKESTAISSSTSVPNDKLSLTSSQQETAWQDITKQAMKEKVPANFTAKVGAVMPSGISMRCLKTTGF